MTPEQTELLHSKAALARGVGNDREADAIEAALDENTRLRMAVRALLDWDHDRKFIVPYRIRDSLIAALNPTRKD